MTTTTSQLQQKKKRASGTVLEIAPSRIPSAALQEKIKQCVRAFGNTRDKVLQAFEMGQKEGFSELEIGKMLRKAYGESGFNPRNIVRFFPDGAKMKVNLLQREDHYAIQRDRESRARRRLIIRNMEPAEYRPSELQQYTRAFLIEIIKWYEQKEAQTLALLQRQTKKAETGPKTN